VYYNHLLFRYESSLVMLCSLVAFFNSIREEHGIPPHKRYFIMFVRGHTELFLRLCDVDSKGRHKGCYS